MPLNGFVPLSADPRYQRDHTGRRMRLFADAYGLSQAPRQQLVPTLAGRPSAMHTFLAQRASGTHPWARLRRKATATPGEPVPNTSASERKRGGTHFSNKERHSLRRLSASAWGQRKLAFLWRDAAAA